MRPLDLISTARRLARQGGSRRPRQTDLKRALSTAYYAMFHALCWNCADCLIGGKSADRSDPAWLQAYRTIDHKFAKAQCSNGSVLAKFPKEIEDFAGQFKILQEKRHEADYDPTARFSRVDVETFIDAAELAIKQFQKTGIKHRRAFAAWTAMKARQT